MAKRELPFVGVDVDESDPSGSAVNLGIGVVLTALSAGVIGGGVYLYNQAKAAAGMEGRGNIPGV